MTTEFNEYVHVSLKQLIDLAKSAVVLKKEKQKFIQAKQSGNYLSRFKERGMEFDETRLYQEGDDVRRIDWLVTARTGKVHTKIFREERECPVFISVDNRAAMHFGTRGVFKYVQAAKIAALLAWSAQSRGDRIGGQIFSETQCLELKPQTGQRGVLHFLNQLSQQTSPDVFASKIIDFDSILMRLIKHAKPGSLVYLISDFRGLSSQTERYFAQLSRHCNVTIIFVYDALEKQLPQRGIYRFTDKINDVLFDSSERQTLLAYQKRFHEKNARLIDMAQKHRMRFLHCSTTENPIECLK